MMRAASTVLVLAVAMALSACGQEPRSESAAPQPAPARKEVAPGEVGTPLPAFRLKDYAGREVSLEDFRGKVLLVDYWATWCKPCEVEMPGYQRLQEQYGERGLAVVGIAMDTDAKEVARFARRHNIRYPLLMGTPEIQQQLGILGIPTTMLVDRSGVIRKSVVGFEHTEVFEAALKDLL